MAYRKQEDGMAMASRRAAEGEEDDEETGSHARVLRALSPALPAG